MLQHYVMAALRNLARNRLYAALNIVGLTIGFASAILIALFIRSEATFDSFVPGSERIFHVSETYYRPGQPPLLADVTLPTIAPALTLDYSSSMQVARLAPSGATLRVGDIQSTSQITWADPDFFEVMPLRALAGDPNAALARPDGVVLTRSAARKYFGRDDPVGQTIEFDGAHRMQVGAVIEDIPANSNIVGDVFPSSLASFSPITSADTTYNSSDSVHTYFRLRPGASIETIRQDMASFVRRHGLGGHSETAQPVLELTILSLPEMHLRPAGLGAMRPSTNSVTLLGVSAAGFLILLIAAINYVTLMTARANKRAIEVGIRKVAGAERRSLVAQFIGESLLYVLLAMIVAVAAVELLLPAFNAFASASLTFAYWRDAKLLCALLGSALILGALAGIYPALILSAFRPASVLKAGTASSAGSGTVRTGLVIAQFAILIGIVLVTSTIYRQTRFALSNTLRVPTDQILMIMGACDEAARNQIEAQPGVQASACGIPFGAFDTNVRLPDGAVTNFRQGVVDFGYFELYGLQPLAGRFFQKSYGADSVGTDAPLSSRPNVVINEAALSQLGYHSPADAIGQTVSWSRGMPQENKDTLPSTIIGVVPDFAFPASRRKIEPEIYFVSPVNPFGALQGSALNVRLDGTKIPETVGAINDLWKGLSRPPITTFFLNRWLQYQFLDVIRQGLIFSAFSLVALILACMGLFGLAAFTTERRTKEIGIRKAMGASSADIVRLFAWEFAQPVLWANAIAWPAAYYFGRRWLQDFAYHVDLALWMFVSAGALALGLALITVAAQAFFAARSKPIVALRYE